MSNILEVQKKFLIGEIKELELKNAIEVGMKKFAPSVSKLTIENATKYILKLIKTETNTSTLELKYSGFISSMAIRNWFANDGIPYLETMD